MRYKLIGVALLFISLAIGARALSLETSRASYSWLSSYDTKETIASRIPAPQGFGREPAATGSFSEWLRNLPLKKGTPPVHLFDGRLKGNQSAHAAVVEIDTGSKDLQQCADAVMRLRAEFFYARKDNANIHFQFTSGDVAAFTKWAEGFRPNVNGNRVSWTKNAASDGSYSSFRAYLNTVFTYAGSASLSQEMLKRELRDLRAGDVFIEGGYPGHAVIIVDTAKDPRSGRRLFLLAQSYMPAQEVHILRNPADGALSPWYDANVGSTLRTPEWTFKPEHLRRFAE
jgi:hypothetical protein